MIEKNIEWSKQEKSLIEKKIRKNLGKYKNIWWLVKKSHLTFTWMTYIQQNMMMDDVYNSNQYNCDGDKVLVKGNFMCKMINLICYENKIKQMF